MSSLGETVLIVSLVFIIGGAIAIVGFVLYDLIVRLFRKLRHR